MATLVVPGAAQIGIEMTASGQPVWNVIGLNIGATTDPPATILAVVKTAWEAANGPMKIKSTLVTMVGYHYTDLRSTTGAVGFLGSTQAGLVTGGLSTMASAALVKLSSGTRSRSQQGRLYHGPLLETQINADGRTIDSTYSTTVNTAYTNFLNAMSTANYPWAIISRKNSTFEVVDTASPASVIATQRRRLR